ncbi:MAG: hypothetical protein GXO39_03305 [Thermotogae bacterium]|nr:hypothetical protein [Thermotogota bacterium]
MAIRKFRESFKWLIWLVAIAFVAWLGLELGANILNFNWTRVKPWQEGIVAEIGDYQLTIQEYDAAVQRAVAETLAVRGVESLSPEEEEAIRDAVFYQLVDLIRWRKLAEKHGIKLSDKAVLTLVALSPPPALLRDTTLNKNGQFDYQRYLQILNDKRYAPIFAAYEQELRRAVPAEITRGLFLKIPSISRYEMWKEYERNNTKYGFSFINLVYSQIQDTPTGVSEAQLKEFYRKNKKEFRKPPRANLYIVRVDKVPLKIDSLQAKELAETAYEEAKTNWEGAVKVYSEDPASKDRGGVIGWFAIDDQRLPPEIAAAVKNADTGAVLGPFLLPFGWDIIKVVARDTASDSLQLAHILITVKLSQQSKQEIRDSLISFLERAKKEKDFLKLAKEYGFRVDSTGLFSLSDGFIPFVGPDRALLSWIKRAKVGEVSDIIYRPQFYMVAKLIDKREAGVPPYEEVKEEVKRKYVLNYKRQKGLSILEEIKRKLESGVPLDSIPNLYPNLRLGVGSEDSASANAFVRGLVAKDLFFSLLKRVKSGGWRGPYDYKNGAYLVFKRYEVPVSEEEFKEKYQVLLSQEFQKVAMKFMGAFSQELEDLYPLKDYRGYIY